MDKMEDYLMLIILVFGILYISYWFLVEYIYEGGIGFQKSN